MEYLGFITNSELMTIYLPLEKVGKTITLCEKVLATEQVTIKEMTSFLDLLTSTYQAVFPRPLHYRSLQMQQIRSLREIKSYET